MLRYAGPRYVIVDYKTNKIFAGPVDAAQFDQAAMAAEMMHSHYPLQALLYSVALHRYLRWRQPGYTPRTHLGGVQYLFVRAMVGADTPRGCGVFDWHPPAAAGRRAVGSAGGAVTPIDDAAGRCCDRLPGGRSAYAGRRSHRGAAVPARQESRTSACGWLWRWRCGRCGTARCAWNWTTSATHAVDADRADGGTVGAICPGPNPASCWRRCRRSPLVIGGPRDRCGR